MARGVFFSFHYKRDVWRASVVRNSWVDNDREAAGFWDADVWQAAMKKGEGVIEAMINNALKNTSVTVVLIGRQTANRQYVKYAIDESIARGNGILGVRIEKIANSKGEVDDPGSNPLPSQYPVYLWNKQKGYAYFGEWVEAAAKVAGR